MKSMSEGSLCQLLSKENLENMIGCEVVRYTVSEGSEGADQYTSVMFSVSAEIIPSDGGGSRESRHYLLKCYHPDPVRQEFASKANMFHNELSFYTIWAKELVDFQTRIVGLAPEEVLHPSFPSCTGGKAIDFASANPEELVKVYQPMDNFVMMTDLRKAHGFQMADIRKGLNYHQVRLAMIEYATMHALSWTYRKRVEWQVVDKFPFLKVNFEKQDFDLWQGALDDSVEKAVKIFNQEMGKDNPLSEGTRALQTKAPVLLDNFVFQKIEYENAMWSWHREPPKQLVEAGVNDEPWRIICHGDTHCKNMLFKSDTSGTPTSVCFVDFQLVRSACPTLDLVYMIYTSTTGKLRQEHQEELLDLYHDRFNEVCTILGTDTLPGFSKESFRRRFHRSKPMGYMLVLLALVYMIKDDDTEKQGQGANVLKQRLLEVAQPLYEQGVI